MVDIVVFSTVVGVLYLSNGLAYAKLASADPFFNDPAAKFFAVLLWPFVAPWLLTENRK